MLHVIQSDRSHRIGNAQKFPERAESSMSVQFPVNSSQLLSDITFVAIKVLVFLVIIVAGIVIGKVLGNLIGRLIARAGGDSLLKQTVIGRALMRSDYASFKLANSLTKWFVYIAAILYALYSL